MNTANPDILESPRFLLREWNATIYDNLMRSGSDTEIMKFFGFETEDALQAEKERFSNGAYTTFNKTLLIFHILDTSTKRILGWCGYHTWYVPHSRAEIGYVLRNESDWGKGYMTEVLPQVLQYGFEQMKLNRIEAFVGPDSVASTRLLKNNGFQQEGYLRQHYFSNNVLSDSLLFALLKEERYL